VQLRLCQKKERRVFDVRKQRVGHVEAEGDLQATRGRAGGGRGDSARKPSKWRLERARLQEAIEAGKQISQALREGRSLASLPAAVSALPDDRTQCPHCMRRFAETAAERHIPHCKQTQSRMSNRQNSKR
jgi:hypothetical protein